MINFIPENVQVDVNSVKIIIQTMHKWCMQLVPVILQTAQTEWGS